MSEHIYWIVGEEEGVQKSEEMVDNYSFIYLVVNVERKEREVFWR